eukprot:1949337-Prymnesium_polylepis.1
MVVSVPKPNCSGTVDAEWGCPACYWALPAVPKAFWAACLAPAGSYRVELLSNTQLFPHKPAAYCQREHYSVLIHKKVPPSVYVYQGARGDAKVTRCARAAHPPVTAARR